MACSADGTSRRTQQTMTCSDTGRAYPQGRGKCSSSPSSQTPPEDAGAQARLAKATGVTAYEARLALAGGFPTIVLTTGDEAKANALAATLRAGGTTRSPRRAEKSRSRDDGRVRPLHVRRGGGRRRRQRLPYADVSCLLRAVHRSRATTQTQTTRAQVRRRQVPSSPADSRTRRWSPRRAPSRRTSREPVLYVFRRSGETPWLLRGAADDLRRARRRARPDHGREFPRRRSACSASAHPTPPTTNGSCMPIAPSNDHRCRGRGRARRSRRRLLPGSSTRSRTSSRSRSRTRRAGSPLRV